MSRIVKQKIYGAALLVLCVFAAWASASGATMAERDRIGVVMLAPIGTYLVLTKEEIIE